jgi:hypothetical protein
VSNSGDPDVRRIQDVIDEIQYVGGEFARETIESGLMLIERFKRHQLQRDAREGIAREAAYVRYQRRAANQLIKALKGLY